MYIKQSTCEAAENALGLYFRRIRNEWFQSVRKNALEECNNLCMKMLQTETRTNIQAHRNVQKEAKSSCTKKKKKMQYEGHKLEELKDGSTIRTCFNCMKKYERFGRACTQGPVTSKYGIIVRHEKVMLEVREDLKQVFYSIDMGIIPDEKVYIGPQLLPYTKSQVSQES